MNRWAKAAVQGAACGLVFGVVMLAGGRLWQPQSAAAQAKEPAVPDVVRARRFEVVDAAGKERALLAVYPDGNLGLMLFDAARKLRALLALHPEGDPGLMLFDAAGKVRGVLAVRPGGGRGPGLVLLDAAGKVRAGLGVDPDGNGSFKLFDKDGKVMWQAP